MRSRGNLLVAAILLVVILLVGSTFLPLAQASTKKWRNLNPTEYTSIPNVSLKSIYVLNGGTGGIGSGDAWEVGNNGTIFQWDGFSWKNYSSGTPCNLNSVNFGSPLTVPMTPFSSSSSSASGFIVGGNVSTTVCPGQFAMFWNGISWFPITNGLLTTSGNLSSVFVTSVSSSLITAVAVGQNVTSGTSYFFNGIPPITPASAWTQVFVNDPAGSAPPLTSVYMVSTTEGWAAARLGRIFHYSAGGWVLAPGVPVGGFPGVDFRSIFMVSTTDGWAVGSNAQIAHYTGGIWTCCVSPTGVVGPPFPTLRSLSFVSSSEAWAVGDAVGGASTIVHGTSLTGAASWAALSTNQIPTLRGLRGVHATGGSNVWAVGETGSVLLWDGSIWGSITAPLQTNFNDVFMTSSNDGLAVGNATSSGFTIVRWDGVKWTRPQGSLAVTDLWGVWEVNSGEWWVVGSPVPGGGPHVARYLGGVLADVTPPPGCATCTLLDVFGTASNNIWAVGTGGGPGQSAIAHWTGSGWSYAPTFNPVPAGTTWRSVTFVQGDQNNGWVVGFTTTGPSPLVYEYTATTQWFTVPVPGGVPATTRLNSVQFLDSSHGWIAGSNGIILFWNGAVLTPTFTVGSYNLTSIFVDSTTDGWVVGQDTATNLPVFLHYDGTGWTTIAISPPIPLTNVGRLNSFVLPPGSDINGFAVGTTAGNPNTMPPSAGSLGMMFHLDPPAGAPATTTSSTPAATTTSVTPTSSVTSTSVSSSTSSTPVTTTSSLTTTVVSTSVSMVTTTVVSTPATTTSSSTVSTPMVLPPIPGFPWESILAGIILGLTVLAIARRRRK